MLDELDRSIIAFLQYDGRMAFTQIATELGTTEGTVRRRVKQLIDNGLMQIVAIVEPHDLGWQEAAMIGISVQTNLISSIADEIAKLPEVAYLFQAAGEFDLVAEVFCKDREHFVSFLNNKLQQISGVERTQSFMILKMHKLSYRWGEAEPPQFSNQLKESSEQQEKIP
ncbi:MAG: Lrp/AsnC family transcriptional regulator [Anaerolineales bacterium]|jgi:Lrp/AsnC family transcriptional regulator for asnA, asnC and gidA